MRSSFSSRPRDRRNYFEGCCPIIKTSNSSHFHIPLIFLFSFYKLKKDAFTVEWIYHKDINMFRLLNKVKSCSVEIVLGWVTKYEYPVTQCCNNFFSFFSPSFSKAIFRRAELASLCNVVFFLFINFLFLVFPWPYSAYYMCAYK